MRSKSWPLYDDWCEIFGQSRATSGAGASHLRATTPPPSFSANIDVDEASNKVGDETQDESESPSGHAQTGESNDMGKTSSGRKRKTPLPVDPMEKLRATTLIARNAEDIDVFFSLPDTDRMEWVTMLLNGDI
ncbi:hypothetical protein ACS0TY_033628 [Phlomoides rotata]